MIKISALVRDPTEFPSPFHHEMTQRSLPLKEGLTWSCWHPDLRHPAPRTVTNKWFLLLFISYSVCGNRSGPDCIFKNERRRKMKWDIIPASCYPSHCRIKTSKIKEKEKRCIFNDTVLSFSPFSLLIFKDKSIHIATRFFNTPSKQHVLIQEMVKCFKFF